MRLSCTLISLLPPHAPPPPPCAFHIWATLWLQQYKTATPVFTIPCHTRLPSCHICSLHHPLSHLGFVSATVAFCDVFRLSPPFDCWRCAASENLNQKNTVRVIYCNLVYTTQVNSAFRALWLINLEVISKHYSPPSKPARKIFKFLTPCRT